MPAHDGYSTTSDQGSLRRRALALAIAIAIEALLVWMLLNLAGYRGGRPRGGGGTTTMINVQGEKPQAPHAARKQQRQQVTRPTAQAPKSRLITSNSPIPPKHAFKLSDLGIIDLSKQDYAAADVSKLPSHAAEAASGSAGSGSGAGNGEDDTPSTGGGPNGEPLYYAQWYREPTDAELATYVQGRVSPGAWAEVACRTVARYHVDDCQELGDSPAGSRLAGAIRQAAFQFLVRPPRVGGKSLVGAWVRIRIHWTDHAVPR